MSEIITFIGPPNHLVRFQPPIGNVKFARFDENGRYTTANLRVIDRFKHKFDSVPYKTTMQYTCKKCDFSTDNRGELMAHYRQEHPKEE